MGKLSPDFSTFTYQLQSITRFFFGFLYVEPISKDIEINLSPNLHVCGGFCIKGERLPQFILNLLKQ